MDIIQSIPISEDLIYNNKPLYIILLDSRTPSITIEDLNTMHKRMGLKMFAYHYFIDKQGLIYQGRPETAYPANIETLLGINTNDDVFSDNYGEVVSAGSISSANKIFICLEGNTELSNVTNSQYTNLLNLCRDIVNRNINIKNVYSLNELIPSQNNLGSYFQMNTLRSEVFYTNLPIYTTNPSGSTTYTFGKRSLYYDEENLLVGNDVKLLQLYLEVLNIPIYKKNGIFDLFTYNAVKVFQNSFNLEVTGIMEEEDFEKLTELINNLNNYSDPSSYHRLIYLNEPNLTGADIRLIQEKLKSLMYEIEVNGIYDENTCEIIKEFQSEHNLVSDGMIGPITYNTLMNSIATVFTRILKYNEDDSLMYGDDVLYIQNKIKKVMTRFGITTISTSGYYDLITRNNIIKIQKSQFLPLTGEVDEILWNFIKNL